jgi:hypothetical protein
MKNTTQRLLAGIVMASVFAACSRPVAYFQPSQREHFATNAAKTAPVAVAETPVSVATETPTTTATPVEQLAQANATMTQVDALVSNNKALSTDKTVQKRLNRVRTLLASASTKASLTPTETSAPKKMNLMERMMLKKMNKKISKQLAPANPEKTMISTGTLATGAVLVILGLLLLLLTTGTGATVGLIVLLVGAVVLVVGLL